MGSSAGMPYGLQAMLKDGYTHTGGMSEAVYKNLEACKELSKICRTSLGPNGTLCSPRAVSVNAPKQRLCSLTGVTMQA